jgi:RNA polymerase-binding protein DksA
MRMNPAYPDRSFDLEQGDCECKRVVVAKPSSKKTVSSKGRKAVGQSKNKTVEKTAINKTVQKAAVPKTTAQTTVEKSNRKAVSPPHRAKTTHAIAPARYQPEEEPPIEIPQASAVPTNGRPRKNMAGHSPRELELFRDAILAKRREIVGDMSSMEREALRSSSGTNLSNLPLHMADMGTDNYEQEFTLGLMEKDRKLLRDLNDALAKIQNGTYGLCEGTGKPISKARLEAQPWARYSIEYARKIEHRLR